MKTFLVTTRNQTVIINGKSYYYNNIISVKDNDTSTLDYCKMLVSDGRLSVYSSTEPKKVKVEKPKSKKSKSNKNYKSKEQDKNKNNKKEEK